jgi:hypothetical protein
MNKQKLNRVIIKRNWMGKITEISIEIVTREPEGRPPLELAEVVAAIFSNLKEY